MPPYSYWGTWNHHPEQETHCATKYTRIRNIVLDQLFLMFLTVVVKWFKYFKIKISEMASFFILWGWESLKSPYFYLQYDFYNIWNNVSHYHYKGGTAPSPQRGSAPESVFLSYLGHFSSHSTKITHLKSLRLTKTRPSSSYLCSKSYHILEKLAPSNCVKCSSSQSDHILEKRAPSSCV